MIPILQDLVQLHNIGVPGLPQYLQLLGQPEPIRRGLDILLVDDLNRDLLVGKDMPGYFDLIEGALADGLAQDILSYSFLGLFIWGRVIDVQFVHLIFESINSKRNIINTSLLKLPIFS